MFPKLAARPSWSLHFLPFPGHDDTLKVLPVGGGYRQGGSLQNQRCQIASFFALRPPLPGLGAVILRRLSQECGNRSRPKNHAESFGDRAPDF